MTDGVVVDRLGAVTQLTLDRQRSANAITVGMARAIAAAIEAFATDDSARPGWDDRSCATPASSAA